VRTIENDAAAQERQQRLTLSHCQWRSRSERPSDRAVELFPNGCPRRRCAAPALAAMSVRAGTVEETTESSWGMLPARPARAVLLRGRCERRADEGRDERLRSGAGVSGPPNPGLEASALLRRERPPRAVRPALRRAFRERAQGLPDYGSDPGWRRAPCARAQSSASLARFLAVRGGRLESSRLRSQQKPGSAARTALLVG
jgi:hypothetical protein